MPEPIQSDVVALPIHERGDDLLESDKRFPRVGAAVETSIDPM